MAFPAIVLTAHYRGLRRYVALSAGPAFVLLSALRRRQKVDEQDERDVTRAGLPGLRAAGNAVAGNHGDEPGCEAPETQNRGMPGPGVAAVAVLVGARWRECERTTGRAGRRDRGEDLIGRHAAGRPTAGSQAATSAALSLLQARPEEHMPDICDLILGDHETFRRRLAGLDEQRGRGTAARQQPWEPLGGLLDLHAAAEEEVFCPRLLRRGQDARAETSGAIADHDAVASAARLPAGGEEWWQAVRQAREQSSDHMAEEERGALTDFRGNTPAELRQEQDHAGGRRLRAEDKDLQGYVEGQAP